MQVTLAINAAKLQLIVYSSRAVGVGYVHRRLSNSIIKNFQKGTELNRYKNYGDKLAEIAEQV